MSDIGNSNRITRAYLDQLMIETRYLDSESPDLTFQLFGETFPSPIMTAALSHLDHFMFPGAAQALAEGARDAGDYEIRHMRQPSLRHCEQPPARPRGDVMVAGS